MTDQEKREAARKFYNNWKDKSDEKQHAQSFWRALLSDVFGVQDVDQYVEFEKRVVVDGQTKFIDGYIPDTRVMIEQKSGTKDLGKPEPQSGGAMLTPYQQAKRYSNNMPLDQMPRYIITCNFREFWIYDQNKPGQDPEVVKLDNLPNEYPRLEFLVQQKKVSISQEMQLSIKAGELVGKIHDRFLTQYNDPLAKHTQRSLNILCVRLVFCLYAEDAGLFGARDAFEKYISQYEPKDIRRALIDLFQVLNTPLDERADLYLADDLAEFPYVNGGLFATENIVIPKITEEIKQTLLESSHFDWSKISPTIFGAVFESTLNPETRRAGGMHYTSIENIHKVIDPLFLEDLQKELAEIADITVPATQKKRLKAYQDKLASLKFLDPACGSGNFLTETYLSLRRLENEVIRLIIAADRNTVAGQIVFGFEEITPIKVSIGQFYGIEINDFAVTVAKTALWIAESQMLQETEDIVHTEIEFLPLKSYANIIEGNALQMDWNKVINRDELNYCYGNPPFVGYSFQTRDQKKDILSVYVDETGKPYNTAGEIDYVAGWYFKAAQMMNGSRIRTAFVSTNSITQGEQVCNIWKPIYDRFGIHIDYAYRTFRWNSEASLKASVHCVIIGFSAYQRESPKIIFQEATRTIAENINAYLLDAPDIFIDNRSKPLCNVSSMTNGNKPADGGSLFLSQTEREQLLSVEPNAAPYVKRVYGSAEYINNKERYCFWFKDVEPGILRKMPKVMERIEQVRQFRLNSPKVATQKSADYPMLFQQIRQPETDYIIIPRVSSQNRRYVPIGFMTPEIIVTDSVQFIPDADLYEFGVITSNVHMAWMRAICGRLKSDYRYSAKIVYNNFPWPTPTPEQKSQIEQTAQVLIYNQN